MTVYSGPANARAADLCALTELLGANIPEVSAATVRQLARTWQNFYVIRCDCGTIAAAGSLQPIPGQRGEIRGLVVAKKHRGRGLATAVVEHLLNVAQLRGVQPLCITRRPDFFRRFGFQETAPTWLDHPRRRCDAHGQDVTMRGKSIPPRIAMSRAHPASGTLATTNA